MWTLCLLWLSPWQLKTHNPKLTPMCIQTKLQQKIAELTNDGEDILRFLTETVQGKTPDVKTCHQMEAARHLIRLGILNNHAAETTNTVEATPRVAHPDDNTPSPLMGEGWGGGESSHNPDRPEPVLSAIEGAVEGQDHAGADKPLTDNSELITDNSKLTPTLYDIVAYPIARYIRDRTNEGETLIEALRDVMHDNGEYDTQAAQGFRPGAARPPAKPHHKLAAATEILRRALGESSRRRAASVAPSPLMEDGNHTVPAPSGGRLGRGQYPNQPVICHIDDSDPINGHLAKLVRDKTADGTEAAELMIRIAENDRSEGDWTPAHRVSAAKELIHRAYDLNYDAVTWEHVEAYKRATDFADDGEKLARTRILNGRHALLREFKEAYESGDEEAAQRAEDKYNAYNRYIKEGKDPEEAMKYANYGPNDPDPEDEQDKLDGKLFHYRPNTGQDEASDNRTVAATIRAPKLTIPLHKKSLPP